MSAKQRLFPQAKNYKEILEYKYLVRQNVFVLLLISFIGLVSVLYLILIKSDLRTIMGLSSGFLLIIIFNIASLAYGMTNTEFLKFNKFVTSIGFFTLMIIYVLYFKSPSIIPFLFLAYLVSAIYKDLKVLTIISLYFILTIVMFLLNYSFLFNFRNNPSTNYLVIIFFVFFFLSLLMISTYILIKESQFFYNEISFSKEKELRNLDLLIELKDKVEVEMFDHKVYYDKTRNLFKAFTDKLKIEDIFIEKIDIMDQLSQGKKKIQLLKDYPNLTIQDLNRLEKLVMTKDSILRKIALRLYYFNQKKIHEKEIFSETYFESLNKSSDEIEVKIIIFAIFYVTLKKGLPGIDPLTDEDLYDSIINTDFYHFINPSIRKIYEENHEVFETIVADLLSEVIK